MWKIVATRNILAFFVLAAVMSVGCAPPTKLKMRRETADWHQEQVMVQRALERFDEVNAYAYDWRPGITASVVVDLKADDRLVKPGPGWRKINTRQEFDQTVKDISAVKVGSGAKVYRIEDEGGEIWGFFVAPRNMLPYSIVDEKTMELGMIPPPPSPGP